MTLKIKAIAWVTGTAFVAATTGLVGGVVAAVVFAALATAVDI